jgi:hypothetical protein
VREVDFSTRASLEIKNVSILLFFDALLRRSLGMTG